MCINLLGLQLGKRLVYYLSVATVMKEELVSSCFLGFLSSFVSVTLVKAPYKEKIPVYYNLGLVFVALALHFLLIMITLNSAK